MTTTKALQKDFLKLSEKSGILHLSISNDAKALYLGLLLNSDDEGVVINHLTVMKLLDSDERVLAELIDKDLIIKSEDIYVIKHWYQHNQIQPSKKRDSLYQKELSRLIITDRKEYVPADQT